MENLLRYLTLWQKRSVKKARQLLDENIMPEALTIWDNEVTAVVEDNSVCLRSDGVSCSCIGSRAGQHLCYHIIFLLLYLRDMNFDNPEIIKVVEKIIEKRFNHYD